MRFWVILSNMGRKRVGADNEGHPVKVFVDTGANGTRRVGKQVLHVSGDRDNVQTEVGTSLGNFLSGVER